MPNPRITRTLASLTLIGALTASAATLAATPAFAKGATTTAGGGGSGKAVPVTLPATWPADVPAPAFALTGTNVSARSWVLAFTVPGDAPDAAAYINALYGPAGFTSDPNVFMVLRSPRYTITVAMMPKDHTGPLNENVVLQLSVN